MSKTLSIMRHALAGNGGWQTLDIDREILPDGISQTEFVANKMLDTNLTPDTIWTSTATRAQQTAQIVADKLNLNLDFDIKQMLYRENVDCVIDEILSCDDSISHLLIVAHNPLVSELTSQLSGTGYFGWFGTSELVSLEFATDNWSDILTAKISSKLKLSPSKI